MTTPATPANRGESTTMGTDRGLAAASPTAAADLATRAGSSPGAAPGTTPGTFAVEEQPRMPLGFAAGGFAAGIKASGRPDVAVVAVTGPQPAAAAAVFTGNLVKAAPVRLSHAHLQASGGRARGVVVSSGCANAATGAAGDADQASVAAELARALGCREEETLLAATGLIGTRLPVERVRAGIAALLPAGWTAGDRVEANDAEAKRAGRDQAGSARAGSDRAGSSDRAAVRPDDTGLGLAVDAMMTTDTRRKAASVSFSLPGSDGSPRQVRVSGIVKGVGMINPSMATMIAVILTDAAAEPSVLRRLLGPAVSSSFDLLTVDGDMSTNDTVFLLASGESGSAEVVDGSPAADALGAALAAVCRSLARQQAADGEGATTLITCRVAGAVDDADARAVARAVVSSNLLKAAVCGRDPNWGRAAAAAGAARRPDGTPVGLQPERLSIAVCGTRVFAGEPVPFDPAAVRAAMAAPEVMFELDLGSGSASAEAWGCDLTEAYVRENSEYST